MSNEVWQVIGHNTATETERLLYECTTESAAVIVAREYSQRLRSFRGGPLLTGISWVDVKKKDDSQDGEKGQGRPEKTEE